MKKILPLFLILAFSLVGCKGGGEPQDPADAYIQTSVKAIELVNTRSASKKFTLTTAESWTTSLSETKATPTWLTISPTSGKAGTVEITVSSNQENGSQTTRYAYITIKSGMHSKTIAITQSGSTPVVYNVTTRGTLGSILTATQKEMTSHMKLTGLINADDFLMMRNQMPNLSVLDLSEVDVENNKIPDYAFAYQNSFWGEYIGKESLTKVIFPKNLAAIGKYAFTNCNGLKGEFSIPSSVITIEEGAFLGCSGFTGSLTIPNSVTKIGGSAFQNCSGMTGSITIPNGLTEIEHGLFSGCSGLTGTLTIPNGVTLIGSWAFYGCYGLSGTLSIPSSVTTIEESAFYDCTGLTGTLNIASSVESIGRSAFSGCYRIDKIRVQWISPITYGDYMFPGDKTVEVPIASIELYKAKEGWKYHPIIGY